MTRFTVYQVIRSLGYINDSNQFKFDCKPEEVDIKKKLKDNFRKDIDEQKIDDGLILIQYKGVLKAIAINDDIIEGGLETLSPVYGIKPNILLLVMNYFPKVVKTAFIDEKFEMEIERVYQQYIDGTKTRLLNLIGEINRR